MNRTRTASALVTPALLATALLALTACTQESAAEGAATPSATVPATVAISESLPGATSSSSITTTTERATTTTEAPTTTAAPTTTTIPPNIVDVGRAPVPITAVGKSDGDATRVLQERLTQLGFWVGTIDGDYGNSTTQAVMAFQKYVAIPATGVVDQITADRMTNGTQMAHGLSDTGTLVEVDKYRQLLFIVVDGKAIWTINTSTGSGIPYEAMSKKDFTKVEKGDAITPNGLWMTDRERADGWWEGDLGKIYRPKYFHGGIAIHGMTSVPNYPASHGCVRVSLAAMDFIWDSGLVPLGTPVWVHELLRPIPPAAPAPDTSTTSTSTSLVTPAP